jgi:GNAT superfamily N-acetyltransferase
MSIRPLEPADVPPLSTALAALPLLQRYGRTADAVARDLEARATRGESVLVLNDGGLRGLVWFTTQGTLGGGGYLRLLAVVAPAQGRGVGARLLGAFEDAVAAHSRHAFLLVSDFNHGAQRFYERHGYARIGTIPAKVLPDVDEVVYWKRLTA